MLMIMIYQPILKKLWDKLHGTEHKEGFHPSRSKVEKLVLTLNGKANYIVHYRNLQLYIQLGLKLKRIHKVIQFQQKPYLKPYIDFNTECESRRK